jgi:hypothetical protein
MTARGALHQEEAVTESVLEPFFFLDETDAFVVYYKLPHVKMRFSVSATAVKTSVIIDAPTKEMAKELSNEIVLGEIEPIERSMAVSLGETRVWPDTAKKVDTATWIGVQMKINKKGDVVEVE